MSQTYIDLAAIFHPDVYKGYEILHCHPVAEEAE